MGNSFGSTRGHRCHHVLQASMLAVLSGLIASLVVTAAPAATAPSACAAGVTTGPRSVPTLWAAAVAVTQSPTGLSAQTTYHYRLVAENSIGRTEGEDRTFTTLKAPTGEQLAKMAVTEPFDGSTASLSNFSSSWTALSWTGKKGEDSKTGWRPIDAFPTVNGVFYAKSVAASANGIATVATLAGAPTISERFFSLWLDMSKPASVKSGYELRFTETATALVYEVTLSKWASGTKTLLATKSGYSLPIGSSFALVAKAGTVSVWTKTASEYTQLLSSADSTYASGYAGLEGAGNNLRLSEFKAGQLAAF